MAYFISDQLNLNKEKVEIAASVSKSDLVSGLVSEFPELQGIMGKYFAIKDLKRMYLVLSANTICLQILHHLFQKNQLVTLFQL